MVRQSFPGPPFQDSIDADAFRPFEFLIVEIGIVNHLADFVHGFVPDAEAFCKRFKRAVIPAVREVSVQHVERNNATTRPNFGRENKLRSGVDEFLN